MEMLQEDGKGEDIMCNYAKRISTICWGCAKATGNCSWSDYPNPKPVKGWRAVRNDIQHKDGTSVESYIVIECPEFIKDAEEYGQTRLWKK